MFETLDYQVVSQSTGEVYYIELSRNGDNLTCTCTCPAGQKGMHCKHRLSILNGDISDVDSGDTDKMHLIEGMLEGTDVDQALNELRKLEEQKAELDKAIKAQKKVLGKSLND